jgi:hypothetical protein
LLIAEQYRSEFLVKEQKPYEREITEWQRHHELLREIWQGMEEEQLKNRYGVEAQKEQLLPTGP